MEWTAKEELQEYPTQTWMYSLKVFFYFGHKGYNATIGADFSGYYITDSFPRFLTDEELKEICTTIEKEEENESPHTTLEIVLDGHKWILEWY